MAKRPPSTSVSHVIRRDSTWWKEDYAQMRRAIAAARRVSTDAVVSPGETLRAELAARGLSQRKCQGNGPAGQRHQ